MSLLGVAMPVFWIAILLILIFSINLAWFPATGGVGAGSMVLPAVALGLGAAGLIARLVRSSMLEVLRAEYIVTARSKGLREAPVIVRHALRNALIPLVTIVGLQIGNLLSGAVVVETVFARQGIGSMLIKGIVQKDFPLVQGLILFIAVVYIGINIAHRHSLRRDRPPGPHRSGMTMSADTGQKWLAGTDIGRLGREADLRHTARGKSLTMLTLRELARNPGAVIGGLMLAVDRPRRALCTTHCPV